MAGDIVSVEREIRAGADELWARISDVTRMAEWSPENVSAAWLDGAQPGALGSRFQGTNRNGAKTCYTFEPTGHMTRVVETWEDTRNVLARLVAPLVSGVRDRPTHNRASMERTLNSLKAHTETLEGP